MLTELYDYYIEHPEAMSAEYREMIAKGEKKTRYLFDYLTGMTEPNNMDKCGGI